LIDTVNSYYAQACTGQHLDLSQAPEEATQEDAYLKSIRLQLFSKCSFNPMSVIGYDVG
jgi:geranylgeranyl pyrophosphate synthase